MPTGHDPLTCQLHQGPDAFSALRAPWQDAVHRAAQPSLFMTPVFIEQSWAHFHQAGDQPWLVSVWDDAQRLVGLLPLALRRERASRLSALHRRRTLHHIGTWAGDRPGVLHTQTTTAACVWRVALTAVLEQHTAWHQLDLREIDEAVLPDLHAVLATHRPCKRLSLHTQADTYAGVQPLTGTWQDYFDSRSRHTRHAHRRSQRLLDKECPDLHVEVIEAPEQMAAAFERYLAIERLGWKHGAHVGLWADPRQVAFHRALLPALAQRGQASLWLLRSGDHDIAGLVRFRQGTIAYERFKAFDPAFAHCSPGNWLCAQALQHSFQTGCSHSDVLGLHTPLASRQATRAWYDEEIRTRRLVVTRHGVLGHVLHRLRRWRGSPEPAQGQTASVHHG